jgi:two-component system CheB/CheR fusion protein
MRILPYKDAKSVISGTLITFLNITSLIENEQHQKLLVDELNHRVKNMLTVVMSLATQTMRYATTKEEFAEAFLGRIRALNASYSLVSSKKWEKISLNDLVFEEMNPYQSKEKTNFIIEGPEVLLSPPGALSFGMAIHELATNAIKYGALSVSEGVVKISWKFETIDKMPFLIFTWQEENGPKVRQPDRKGFGMTLIEKGIAHELSAKASITFNEEGVSAILITPVGTVVLPKL